MSASHRRLWFAIHGWCSLPVWLVFCAVCVTGTVAVLSHELTWLTNPAARAYNPDGLPPKPLPELIAAVEREVPGAVVEGAMVLEPYMVNALSFSAPSIPHALAYVNPYTGDVQAINQGPTFIGFMRSLHGWLLFPWTATHSIGYYLVAAMSLVMLGALISGLVIYRRFWRSFTQPKLRTNRGTRTLLGDLHRLMGVWSLWFLLVMSATGLWYLTQAVLWHNGVDVWEHPQPVDPEHLPLGVNQTPQYAVDLNDVLSQAQERFPEFRASLASMPEHPRDYFRVSGSGEAFWFDQYSYTLFVNPWTGDVVQSRSPESMDVLQTLTHIADPLHYGTLGGIWTKVIWFFFGCVLSAMSITGFMIWSRRTFKAAKSAQVLSQTLSSKREALES